MKFNHVTKIQSRQTILDLNTGTDTDATPPTVYEVSQTFRKDGVELAASACTKAMEEAKLQSDDITHVVAVTCTDQSNPGYDLLVCETLQLRPSVQRTLLHGVGCAGGLSALRAAANIAAAESQRGRPARVLVMACELCSLFLKAELHAASCDDNLHIAPALFSDAAAALVVCNRPALKKNQKPIYELQECGSMVVPNTTEYMSYDMTSTGMIRHLLVISKDFQTN
jgi:type III polyketide synthase